jgi:hypothetical protein
MGGDKGIDLADMRTMGVAAGGDAVSLAVDRGEVRDPPPGPFRQRDNAFAETSIGRFRRRAAARIGPWLRYGIPMTISITMGGKKDGTVPTDTVPSLLGLRQAASGTCSASSACPLSSP